MKDPKEYRILIVENDKDDFISLEQMLLKRIENPTIVNTLNFQETADILKKETFDIILLDLNLPDLSGQKLIQAIKKIANLCEVIAIAYEEDIHFTINAISQGVSDYLLKSELNASFLYKSILYAIERKKNIGIIKESERRYSDLFHLNPQPMWVYDIETLKFIRVNNAAIKSYGYTKKDFRSMTLKDILPKEDIPKLERAIDLIKNQKRLFANGVYRHKKKNGTIIYVDVQSNIIYFSGKKYELVLASDVTERVEYIKAIEEQNTRLQEIAFTQSHIVRAPLANMMGMLHLMEDMDLNSPDGLQLIQHFITCGNELDKSIHEIVSKSKCIKISKT